MKLKITYLLFFVGLSLFGQDASFNNQYLFNLLQVNPAYSGTSEKIEVVAGSKLQWLGGLSGTPVTHYLSANTLLGSTNMGIGLSFQHETLGLLNNTNLLVDLSYHIQLYKDQYLSLGIKSGLNILSVNLDNVETVDQGDIYLSGNDSESFITSGFGAFYYSKKLYLGLSIPKLMSNDITLFDGNTAMEEQNPIYIIAGTYYNLNSKWKLRPSLLLRYESDNRNVIDLNAQFIYDDKYWIGTGYKTSKNAIFIAQYKHNDKFKFGYSFDYPLSAANQLSTFQTHELLLSYSFLTKSSIYVSPRFF